MSLPFRMLAPLGLVAAFVLPTAAAQADVFCVGAPAGCHGTASATLQGALDAAAALPGADRVELDADATAHGFTIVAGNLVDLVGVGGVPTIVADSGDPVMIDEPQAIVRSLRFEAGGSGTPAPIDVRRGAIVGSVIVNGTAGVAVRMVDGALRSTRITSGTDADAVGVLADGGTATLEDTSIEGITGIVADAATLALNRVRVTAGALSGPGSGGGSAMRVTGGTVTVDDSAFALAGDGDDATIDVRAPGGATIVTLRSVTVHPMIGDNQPATAQGVRAACSGGGTADVEVRDTVVTAYSTDLVSAGAGCSIDRQAAAYVTADVTGGATLDAGSFLFDAPVMGRTWVEATPTFGSVLIDHSSGRPLRDGETDLNGLPRIVDGWRDIGAYEYQHRAPQLTLKGEAEAVIDTVLGFVAHGEDPDRDPITIAWTLDGKAAAAKDPGSPELFEPRFTSPGPHVVAATVTDSSGLSTRLERTVKVVKPGGEPSNPPKPPVPPAQQPPAPPVVTPPTGPAVTATLLGRRLGAGPLRVKVACRRAVACAGTVRLTAKAGLATLRIGRAAFRVGANGTAVVRIPVRAAARQTLRRHRGLTVRVAVLRASGWLWVAGKGGRVLP